jgi:amino acid adenylation domain-containing protein
MRNASTIDERADLMPAWLEDDLRPLDWNGPVDRRFTRFPDEALDQPIIELLERVARRHRNRIAIGDADTALAFGELWDGLSGLAETLAADTQPGDLIGILLPACPLFSLAMLGCLAAGRAFVALDTRYPDEWRDHVLEDARPTLIITGENGLAGLETRRSATRVIQLTTVPTPARKNWRPARLDVDEPACVLFTSGSTGRPKGIVNSQRNLLQRVAQSINSAHINPEDRFLTLASPCTIVGVRDVMTALLAGASIHLLDPQGVGAREILNVIRAEAITILFAFPALLRPVVAASTEPAGSALRLVRVGGDTTLWSDIDLLRNWLAPQAKIQLIYAATEAPMLQWFVDNSCRRGDARIPIGYPLGGNRLALVDEHGHTTPRGEVGELIVASPYVSLGRWTEGRFAAESVDIACARACRRFRTGDLARQRPDGLLERVGRKDRQVKIRGIRVELDGVEAALREHRCVGDVAALARKSSVDGTATLVAYISAHDKAPAGLIEELRELMRSVPAPMRPARFYLVHRIPRLSSSKLDTRALLTLDNANAQSERGKGEALFAPTAGDRISRTVARVWQDVLGAPVGSPEDDFFDAGGDSLRALTFMIELERAFGSRLSPTLINEAPRFNQLCAVLGEYRAPRYVPLVPLKAGSGLAPIFFIHGIGGNIVEVLPAARRIAWPGAVIGIQARGLADGQAPHSSVEAMAADYSREIKAHQPTGPYYLCGYSFGGLVAFEIARRLSELGNEVRFVGLFDTTMSPLRWPLRAWLSIIGRRLTQGFRTKSGARPESMQRDGTALPGSPAYRPISSIKVAASALIASARYRPGFYQGQLTLFTPKRREPGLPSLESIWRKHARALAVVQTEGRHSTMLSVAHAESTAAAVTRSLDGALTGEPHLSKK